MRLTRSAMAEQGILEGQPEPVLLVGPAELARDRLLGLVRHHLHAGRERMPRADGAAEQIDGLGQQLLEGADPPLAPAARTTL